MGDLRSELIEAGAWDTNDPRDPETDYNAAFELLDRPAYTGGDGHQKRVDIEKSEGKEWLVLFLRGTFGSGDEIYSEARDADLRKAICKTVLGAIKGWTRELDSSYRWDLLKGDK